jgi:hypothetical protein
MFLSGSSEWHGAHARKSRSPRVGSPVCARTAGITKAQAAAAVKTNAVDVSFMFHLILLALQSERLFFFRAGVIGRCQRAVVEVFMISVPRNV